MENALKGQRQGAEGRRILEASWCVVFICNGQKFPPNCCLEPARFVCQVQTRLDPGLPPAAASPQLGSRPGRSAQLLSAGRCPRPKMQDRPNGQPGPACAWCWARGLCHVWGTEPGLGSQRRAAPWVAGGRGAGRHVGRRWGPRGSRAPQSGSCSHGRQPRRPTGFRYKPSIRLFFLLWELLIKTVCLVETLQKLYRKNKQI